MDQLFTIMSSNKANIFLIDEKHTENYEDLREKIVKLEEKCDILMNMLIDHINKTENNEEQIQIINEHVQPDEIPKTYYETFLSYFW